MRRSPLFAGREWLNTRPLGADDLRGKVVLVNFWTYSCINSLRTLPYLRAWAANYKDRGLVVLGVHSPEFRFEHDIANVRTANASLGVDYPVVLEEYAVVDLLDMLGYVGFSALAVQEERSFVEIGKRVGSELVTIVDDGHDPLGLPMAFDFEGVAKQRAPLLEAGVCAGVVYDAQTAARDGRTSTGHGLPAPNTYGPFPINQVMAAGAASRDELIAGLDRGLLVTRFHYTNPVHPKLAIVTGMSVSDVSQKTIANLGWDKIRLTAPVFAGDTIYAESEVIGKRESASRPHQGIVTVRTTGKKADGTVFMTFERSMLIPMRGHAVDDKLDY